MLMQYFKIGDVLLFINITMFRHLELGIALAIPAPNDEKLKATIQQVKG